MKYFFFFFTFKYSAWVNVLCYISPLPEGRKGSNPNRLMSKNYTILTFKNLKLSYVSSQITLDVNTHIHPLTHTKVCFETFPASSRLIFVFNLLIFKRIICLSACTHVKTCSFYTQTHTDVWNVTFAVVFFSGTFLKDKANGVSMSQHVEVKRMFLNKCITFQKIIICCLTCTHV